MLATDGDRLRCSLEAMARVGATADGGVTRLALTDEDRAARELFATWAREAGCEVRCDAIGNVFARRPGADPSLPPVMCGSHLDTQVNGGRYDGAFGVLAGLEVCRRLNDLAIATVAPVEVAVWTHEEGARFPSSCTGSAVFSGALPVDAARALRSFDGPTLGEELDRIGAAGAETPGEHPASAYLEAHIEQGSKLEASGDVIGVVLGIRGIRQLEVIFLGAQAHAGSAMADRRDALVGAADVIQRVRRIAREATGGASATVGQIEAKPNAQSVVPDYARMLIDARREGLEPPDGLVRQIRDQVAEVAAQDGLGVELKQHWTYGPIAFDEGCVGTVREVAGELGLRHLDIVSPAGHDAGYLAEVVPTAMIFVPCRSGISHSPAELAEAEHLEAGCDVLLNVVLRRARPA
jgi:N-carbamoyl-L-amino-acid hydrolase